MHSLDGLCAAKGDDMAVLARLFSYTRTDHLVTRLMLWTLAAAVAATTLGPGLLSWARGGELLGTVQFEPDRDLGLPGHHTDVTSPDISWWSGEASVSLTSPSAADRLLILAPGLVVTALTITLTILLLKMLSVVAAGDPFRDGTARTLRRIALTATATLVVLPLAHVLREATFAAALSDPQAAVLRMPLGAIVALVATAVVASGLAGAFAHGNRLEHDNAGLV